MKTKERKNLAKKIAAAEMALQKATSTEEKARLELEITKLGSKVDNFEDLMVIEEMVQEGKRLRDTGIAEIVISLGGDGALFVSKDGCYRAEGLKVEVKSTVGAGDSVVAAMAYGKEKNLCREEKIRLAVAIGAASVMQDGSQPPEAALVWELAKHVQLKKL